MKTNLKSGNAIVRLLLTHGEKIGILAIGVCTALVIWSAIGRERLGREPNELKDLATKASSHVKEFTWDGLGEEDKKIAEPVPEAMMKKVSPTAYPNFPGSWNPEVSNPVTMRNDPVLLAPIDLEVTADSGLWATANPERIKQKQVEMMKEQDKLQAEQDEERERAQREGGRGQRGRGGEGGGGMYGGGGGEGGYGGGPGAGRGRNRKMSKDAPIVQRPPSGARLQGFEEITAKSWVTVLAKVPIELQTEHYADTLRTSRGYKEQVDIPHYVGYQVDRAEVTSQGLSEWKKVATMGRKNLTTLVSSYPVNVTDVIDPDVKHPILTHRLPPLILKEWGDRVSHSSMPLAEEKARADAEALGQPTETEEAADGDEEEDLFGESDSARGRGESGRMGGYGGGRGGYGGEGGYGGGMGGGYGGEMGGYGGEGGYGGGMGGYGGEGGYGGGEMGGYGGGMGGYGRGGGSMGLGSGTTLGEFNWDHETPHILFRYFDNTVEAGHSYRYRIRLVMRDVNHNVKEHYLSKAVSLRREKLKKPAKRIRWTDWSEQSPVASVPMSARVYLVSAKPTRGNNFNSEPKAEILIKALNSEYAAEVSRTVSFGRGSVMNVVDKAKIIVANKFDELEPPSFKFLTGITVLDFTGGEKLGKNMLMPARALMMDAAGHLYVQEEMEDLEIVDEYKAILEAGKNPRNRGGGRGGPGGGYGGEGGYGGGMGGGYGGEGGYGGGDR